VARILIVAGGCRGRELARQLVARGHLVRITTRSTARRDEIEATGAECWIGTPERLATLRGALENVTIACWLLGSAGGDREAVRALNASRLELFLTQAIDTTARGFVYEAAGDRTPGEDLAAGERLVRRLAQHNAIPAAFLTIDPARREAWLAAAIDAIDRLLAVG
jgi:uncharacterized protein YbjT (DUF2867 family)